MEEAFATFATKAGGAEATSRDLTRWFTDSGVLNKKTCNSNNLDVCFSRVKEKGSKTLSFMDVNKLIVEVAKAYRVDHKLASHEEAVAQIKERLVSGKPKSHGTTKASSAGIVERMTDTSQYTGSHKQRFDAEGKGRGLAGRQDAVREDTGYVGAYMGAGTYDGKH